MLGRWGVIRSVVLLAGAFVLWPFGCGNSHEHPAPLGSGGSSNQNACWSKPSYDSCFYCCLSDHPNGDDVWFNALVACACQPSYCATECATTICADSFDIPDAACDDCFFAELDPGTECDTTAEKACSTDPECVATRECESGCY